LNKKHIDCCSAKTWTLTKTQDRKLCIFEMIILRKILGLTRKKLRKECWREEDRPTECECDSVEVAGKCTFAPGFDSPIYIY